MESLSDTSESGDPSCEAVVDWDSQLLGTVDRLWIQRAIAGLPAGSRSVFILHDIRGYGHREISAMLGCSVGNTKAQLHRGHVRLRSMLWKESRRSGRPDERTVATMSPRCGSRRALSRRARLGVSKTAACGGTSYIEKVTCNVSRACNLPRSSGHFCCLAAAAHSDCSLKREANTATCCNQRALTTDCHDDIESRGVRWALDR